MMTLILNSHGIDYRYWHHVCWFQCCYSKKSPWLLWTDGLHLTITFSSTNSTLPFQSRVQHAFCFQFFLFDDDGIEHAQSIISCPLLKRYLLEDNVFGLTALWIDLNACGAKRRDEIRRAFMVLVPLYCVSVGVNAGVIIFLTSAVGTNAFILNVVMYGKNITKRSAWVFWVFSLSTVFTSKGPGSLNKRGQLLI